MDLSALKPLLKPVARELLDKAIFPLIRIEEAKIGNPEVKAFVAALEPLIEAEVQKLLDNA